MAEPRVAHVPVLLTDGRVLVMGGKNEGAGSLFTSAIYDPLRDEWTDGGTMLRDHNLGQGSLLADGRVLIVGGYYDNDDNKEAPNSEIYDPMARTFSALPNPPTEHSQSMTARLSDGRVLIAGAGYVRDGVQGATLFVPSTNSWEDGGTLLQQLASGALVLLPDAGALVIGGSSSSRYSPSTWWWSSVDRTWTRLSDMSDGTVGHTATLLHDGRVLVTGGYTGDGNLDSVKAYDPATDTWSALTPMFKERWTHNAMLLPDGRVWIFGYERGTEIYDPVANHWTRGPSIAANGSNGGVCMLASGRLHVSGGNDPGTLADSLLFDPWVARFLEAPPMTVARTGHTATRVPNGDVVVVGGAATVERFSDDAGWAPDPSLPDRLDGHTATVLRTGELFVIGGANAAGVTAKTWLRNRDDLTWREGPSLRAPRRDHATHVLPDGRLLVFGGRGEDGSVLATTELLDTERGVWSLGAPMARARVGMGHALIPRGVVVVFGGEGADGAPLVETEFYVPGTDEWRAAGRMQTPRSRFGHALTPRGDILAMGGSATPSAAELFDSELGEWRSVGEPGRLHEAPTLFASNDWAINVVSEASMSDRYEPTMRGFVESASPNTAISGRVATALADGRVLLSGGSVGADAVDTASFFETGRTVSAGTGPIITNAPTSVRVGETFVLEGERFTGVSQGASGRRDACPANHPVVVLRHFDSDLVKLARTTDFTDVKTSVTIPPDAHPGWHAMSVVVNGAPSYERSIYLDAQCTDASACSTGFCAGGYCCDSACPSGLCVGGVCRPRVFDPKDYWVACGCEAGLGQPFMIGLFALLSLRRLVRSRRS